MPPEPKDKADIDDGVPDQKRTCPYCSIVIETRPYWSHIATEHPKEYENSQATWLPLYNDYTTAGMDLDTILMVMTELFNTPASDIEAFLFHALYKEKTAAGMSPANAKAAVAQATGKTLADVAKRIK
jgi:hypothetical protein